MVVGFICGVIASILCVFCILNAQPNKQGMIPLSEPVLLMVTGAFCLGAFIFTTVAGM